MKSFESEQYYTDVMSWIACIPDEIDSKKSVPLKKWKVFTANMWKDARDAAWDAARWRAARDAAWTAAQEAAQEAAWRAARQEAAWRAAQYAAQYAAQDAALLATIKICAGLPLNKKHVKYAEERWEANKRGYRVLCDVNGTLYVYKKEGLKQ